MAVLLDLGFWRKYEAHGGHSPGGGVAEAKNAFLISNIGFPSRELFAAKDRKENFYMLGSMGLASSIGLGLALARHDRKVMVLDGDGSVLMNLGTLATIAHNAPENYLLVIFDNCCYGSTGSQPTCTHQGTDLAAMASAAGVSRVKTVYNAKDSVSGFSMAKEWYYRVKKKEKRQMLAERALASLDIWREDLA